MPLFHVLAVALATWRHSDAAADQISTRYSTPVLVTPEGQRICDSSRIVQYLDERHAAETLYPDPEVYELEKRFHDHLAPDTRRVAYFYGFQSGPTLVREMARRNVGRPQAWLFALVRPLGQRILVRVLDVTEDRSVKSKKNIVDEVRHVSDLLGDRQYLVGDRFTAADLSFACMVAPALLVTAEERYGAFFPGPKEAHPEAGELARELRATPAGQHALRMFREEH